MKRITAIAGMMIFAAANMGYAAGEAAFEKGVEQLSVQVRETRDAWQANLHLINAAETGDVVLAGYALENGADLNAAAPNDYHGRTALMIASARGNMSMAIFLVSNGADVNKKGNIGNTALHFASGSGHHETAKYLLDSGADVNAADNMKYTALHMAAFNDSADVVRLLLARGAKVNAKTAEGQTPLALAKIRGNEEIVRILSDAGGRSERGGADKTSSVAGRFEQYLAAGAILKAHEAVISVQDAKQELATNVCSKPVNNGATLNEALDAMAVLYNKVAYSKIVAEEENDAAKARELGVYKNYLKEHLDAMLKDAYGGSYSSVEILCGNI